MQEDDFQKVLSGPYHILDVRYEHEYRQAAVEGALWLPLPQLQSHIEELIAERDVPVLVYCAAGARAQVACHIMQELGYQQLWNVGSVQQAASLTGRPLVAGQASLPERAGD